MTESKKRLAADLPTNEDEAPDLTESPWLERLSAARVTRGRPKSLRNKVSTTIRLDPEIVQAFRSGGPGWQSRINEVLRQWLASR
ncbi:hypothetical protein E2F50_10655 [Rhizobium deserti]|uniref:BrnA antitoxin family protein n=1 Tax=Rhizobium deserti TaxID=2547961 RepID=A0A4R5UKB9_9HYPH|nr:BrnA antitoxin family protein [Rhizobium deserti]TDK37326.1 hypothetical protein E2F50_10655 [Rhizobium deserti]